MAPSVSRNRQNLAAITATGNNEPSYTPLAPADDAGAAPQPIHVAPIPDDVREEYRINPFYKKYTVIVGIPIIGSEKVSDYAFLECAWTLDHLLHGRTMALDALHQAKARVGIIAATEYTMDIPENQQPNMIARGAYNDRRFARAGRIAVDDVRRGKLAEFARRSVCGKTSPFTSFPTRLPAPFGG